MIWRLTPSNRLRFNGFFQDLDISLPFTSRMTMARRIDCEFDVWRKRLIEELEQTCQTIPLSLDAWTSKNSKSMLGVIGHWLTADFQYQERVLEFTEIHGVHSGENMAEIIQTLLAELRIEHKLLAITADNATNNERISISTRKFKVETRPRVTQKPYASKEQIAISAAVHICSI